MKKFVIFILLSPMQPLIAQDIDPQISVIHSPPPGEIHVVSAGTQMHEYKKIVRFDAYVTDAEIKGKVWPYKFSVEPGTPMFPVTTRTKFKACAKGGACGLDDDGDGTFDRIAENEFTGAVKLKAPVRYSLQRLTVSHPDNFQQIITYSGATSDSLKLLYREFKDNFARPAFTEELSIPIGKEFPQDVAVKSIIFRIHEINGLGMRYEILP